MNWHLSSCFLEFEDMPIVWFHLSTRPSVLTSSISGLPSVLLLGLSFSCQFCAWYELPISIHCSLSCHQYLFNFFLFPNSMMFPPPHIHPFIWKLHLSIVLTHFVDLFYWRSPTDTLILPYLWLQYLPCLELFNHRFTLPFDPVGHDRLPLHGLGKDFGRNDAERLFRRLVLEGYLREDLVVGKEDMTFAYLRAGQKCDQFLNNPNASVSYLLLFMRTWCECFLHIPHSYMKKYDDKS